MGLFDWCTNVFDIVTLVCVCVCVVDICVTMMCSVRTYEYVCVYDHGACLQSLTPWRVTSGLCGGRGGE